MWTSDQIDEVQIMASMMRELAELRCFPLKIGRLTEALTERFENWKDQSEVIEFAEHAAEQFLLSQGKSISEQTFDRLPVSLRQEGYALVAAKAWQIQEALSGVATMMDAGVLQGSIPSENEDLALLLIWKRLSPASEGFGNLCAQGALEHLAERFTIYGHSSTNQ